MVAPVIAGHHAALDVSTTSSGSSTSSSRGLGFRGPAVAWRSAGRAFSVIVLNRCVGCGRLGSRLLLLAGLQSLPGASPSRRPAIDGGRSLEHVPLRDGAAAAVDHRRVAP